MIIHTNEERLRQNGWEPHEIKRSSYGIETWRNLIFGLSDDEPAVTILCILYEGICHFNFAGIADTDTLDKMKAEIKKLDVKEKEK